MATIFGVELTFYLGVALESEDIAKIAKIIPYILSFS